METIEQLPAGRVRDLVSTADQQLAALSYDAAIDTYRTALAELSGGSAAVRADIEARLSAAGRVRETSLRVAGLLAEARYHQTVGRLSQAYAAVAAAQALDPGHLAAARLRALLIQAQPDLATQAAPQPDTPAPALDAAPPELPEAPNVVPARTAEVPAVGQPQPAAERAQSCAAPTPTPIEPPTFWQLQDDVSCSEKADYAECRTEPELLSILNPAPAADPPNTNIAGMIAGIVGACAALMAVLSHSSHPASRFSPPAVVFSPASTTAERVYRAGDSVTPPLLLSKAEPEYTREAFQAQLQGTVALYAQIDPSGNAVNLHVLRGLGMGLDARAIEAASKWRFQPGMKNGTPVTFETNLEVNFRLP